MDINRESLKDLFIGFKAAFNTGFRSAESNWQKVATKVTSKTAANRYAWLGQWPKLREWIGDRFVKKLKSHDYTIKNRKFESTIEVSRDEVDDDEHGVYSTMFEEMGHAAATHPDDLVFELLAKSFDELCFDGQPMCDEEHPVGDEDNPDLVSNMQAGVGPAWFLMDTSRPLKPLIFQERKGYDFKSMDDPEDTNVFMRDSDLHGVDARVEAGFGFWQQIFGSKAALNEANFKAARTAMRKFKSDEGRPLKVKPTLLVVGPSLESAAEQLIKTQLINGGENNTLYKAVDVLVVDELG